MNESERNSREFVSIEINGTRYERLEDVPAEFQKFFEDTNNNGMPDFVESLPTADQNVIRFEKRTMRTVSGSDPELRRLLSKSGIDGSCVDRSGSGNNFGEQRFGLTFSFEHVRNIAGTITFAIILAIVFVAIFFLWIAPAIR